MPPKPWETTAANKETIDSNEIASGTQFSSMNSNNLSTPGSLGNTFGNTTDFNNTNTGYSGSYSPYSSGLGSGYGGYGSGYGGYSSYGSGYGGYSSFGSRFGGGYGGFGSYGGGFGNRMGGPDQKGNFMEFAIRYLDSFSYGVSSLCEMTRNIEMNAEGLSRFWGSMRNILVRLFGWFARSFHGGKELLLRSLNFVKEKLFSKPFLAGLIFSGEGLKLKAYNILLRFCIMTLAFSLLAPLMKLKN